VRVLAPVKDHQPERDMKTHELLYLSRQDVEAVNLPMASIIEVVERPDRAVKNLDVVVTSGPILKNPAPVIEAGWLKAGAFASPVDFDSYWTGAALREADKLATDDQAQMEYYRQSGYFQQTPHAYADLGEILCGQKPGRQTAGERTMSVNLGIALEDMATAPMIVSRAIELNIGRRLPL
jgi:ornithine cyclodeaminase/alanine dehydrogenase-like protein (mu-crystallin family)